MIESFIEIFPNTLLGNTGLFLIIASSLYLLSKGADQLVDAAVEAAQHLGVSQLVIGATVVSLGTTSPEAAVSVLAALKGESGLALGNGIGSVICDQGLILGLSMTLVALPLRRKILMRQSLFVLISALLLTCFTYLSTSKTITRPMGFVLVAGLCFYMWISFYWAKKSRDDGLDHLMETGDRPLWIVLGSLIIGLMLLIGGSEGLIPSVSLVATRMGISEAVIAASIVAFGTSLPELVTAIASLRKGHRELILGNILGADGLNILFVIGFSASAVPLKIEPVFYQIQVPVMLFVLFLFQFYLFTTKNYFRRWQGLLLLGCYFAFQILQFWKSSSF